MLRLIQKSEHYQLLGECYVHGIMHGELLKDGPLEFQAVFLA
jgi:hypothetical protein